jgi:hypothetical protein
MNSMKGIKKANAQEIEEIMSEEDHQSSHSEIEEAL